MEFPQISVITPSYNQGAYLEETILSVLNQNYPNLEYIIIDGGSTDNSLEIIRKYEDKLTYWISERDNGMYHALQKGFEKSNGEIMAWINSDDILASKSLFTAAEILNDFEFIEWIGGIPNQIDEIGRSISVRGMPKWNKYKYLQFDFQYIQQEGSFWRRSLWGKCGGYISTQYNLAGDLELWSRFFQFTVPYYITGILGSFRMRVNDQKSLEGQIQYRNEAIQILKEMPRSIEEAKNLKIRNSIMWKLSKRKPFRFLFKLFRYNEVEEIINKFPPILTYDRTKQKFIVTQAVN